MEIGKDKGGTWVYVPAPKGKKDAYYCLNSKGDIVGKIYPEYIPDPDALWERKAKFEGVEPNSHKGLELKPNEIVYKLYRHVKEEEAKKDKKIKDDKHADTNN